VRYDNNNTSIFSSRVYILHHGYITPLLKKEGSQDISEFRPISLVHGFAKIFSKALANRVAPKLNDLIAVNQSTFIKGTSIQDNFMLVNQSAKTFHRRKVPSLFLKLDIARAFDTVSWPFLMEVLRKRGFGRIFYSWIAVFYFQYFCFYLSQEVCLLL
jgi:hypothetical protein